MGREEVASRRKTEESSGAESQGAGGHNVEAKEPRSQSKCPKRLKIKRSDDETAKVSSYQSKGQWF